MFSGRLIDTIKKTTISDIINGMPHPTHEGIEGRDVTLQVRGGSKLPTNLLMLITEWPICY